MNTTDRKGSFNDLLSTPEAADAVAPILKLLGAQAATEERLAEVEAALAATVKVLDSVRHGLGFELDSRERSGQPCELLRGMVEEVDRALSDDT
jgi:hypothetical protein